MKLVPYSKIDIFVGILNFYINWITQSRTVALNASRRPRLRHAVWLVTGTCGQRGLQWLALQVPSGLSKRLQHLCIHGLNIKFLLICFLGYQTSPPPRPSMKRMNLTKFGRLGVALPESLSRLQSGCDRGLMLVQIETVFSRQNDVQELAIAECHIEHILINTIQPIGLTKHLTSGNKYLQLIRAQFNAHIFEILYYILLLYYYCYYYYYYYTTTIYFTKYF